MVKLDLSDVNSSYREFDFGSLFYALLRVNRPTSVVELGTLMGYSALHLASALRDNTGVQSELTLIDLWDKYPYRHCSQATTENNFKKNNLIDLPNCKVSFRNEDGLSSSVHFADQSIDCLHIDTSNDGTSLELTLEKWYAKLCPDALLLLEGGSEERDRIDWMQKYSKKPIRAFLNSDWFRRRFEFTVITPFPSLTIARSLS